MNINEQLGVDVWALEDEIKKADPNITSLVLLKKRLKFKHDEYRNYLIKLGLKLGVVSE